MGTATGEIMHMDTPDKILDDLCAIRKTGYDTGLPGFFDKKFIELAEQYAQSGVAERERIRNKVEPDCRVILIGFSDRLAILADRTKDARLLFFALLAHSIEDFRIDDRENIIRLALVNHVAKKIGESPSELFYRVIRLSSPRAAKHLVSFNNRPENMKSLRVMKIAEIEGEDGSDYRHY